MTERRVDRTFRLLNDAERNNEIKQRLAGIIPPAFAKAVLDDADSTPAFPSEDEVLRVCMAARKRITAGIADLPRELREAVEAAVTRYARDDFEAADSLFVEFHASLGQEPFLRDVDDWNRRCIDEELAALDRGEGSPAEEVFARLRARFGAGHDR